MFYPLDVINIICLQHARLLLEFVTDMKLCHLQHIYLYFVSINGPRSMGIESAVNDFLKKSKCKI